MTAEELFGPEWHIARCGDTIWVSTEKLKCCGVMKGGDGPDAALYELADAMLRNKVINQIAAPQEKVKELGQLHQKGDGTPSGTMKETTGDVSDSPADAAPPTWNAHSNSGMRFPEQSDLSGGETDAAPHSRSQLRRIAAQTPQRTCTCPAKYGSKTVAYFCQHQPDRVCMKGPTRLDLANELAECRKRIAALEAELSDWYTWSVTEVAIRNPAVAEYVRHWEGRAIAAEQRAKSNAELAAANARLEGENKALRHDIERAQSSLTAECNARIEAEQRAEGMAKDAARYRFIRDVPYTENIRLIMRDQSNGIMDAAIDAAIAGGEG